jgi:hypothetical protein
MSAHTPGLSKHTVVLHQVGFPLLERLTNIDSKNRNEDCVQ